MATMDLQNLIERGKTFADIKKSQELSEWRVDVEQWLKENNKLTAEIVKDLEKIKAHGNAFKTSFDVVAYLEKCQETSKSKNIFVAMWFCPDMDKIYKDTYKPVIESLGYEAIRVDEQKYNDLIVEQIYEEIRKSIAIIADVTGNRGGVYHEAGIARGLKLSGKTMEIIFTCRKAEFEGKEGAPHFDVSGNHIIVYEDETMLKDKLRARITGTLGAV
jgi:hypothetical protein